jgi:TolB-like protein/Tfp pilus assembly protein PilF
MAQDPNAREPRTESVPAGGRLDSWKEIAGYLGRGITTVQRWERSEGLPVHRHVHARRGSVWADRAEIDAWWATRGTGIEKREAVAVGLPRRRRRWLAIAAGAALLLSAAAYLLLRLSPEAGKTGRTMVAVLPFQDFDKNGDQSYFSDGLTDETIAELSRLRPDLLGVIARTSAMRYKSSSKGISEIARELNVEYVLEGDVRRTPARVQVDARLIRAADQAQLFAQTYDSDLGDSSAIEGEIGRRVAKSLALELLPLQEARLARPARRDPKAVLAYLKGLELLNERTGEDIYSAVGSFEEAVRTEPTYAQAFAALGTAYVLLPTYGEFLPDEYYAKAAASAERALRLDPTLADAHAILGVVAHEHEWDHGRAEQEYRKAVQLNPSSVLAHQGYAELLTHMGRTEEALGEIREALRLDPHSMIADSLLGWALYYGRRYDEAIEHLQHVVAKYPDSIPAHSYLGWAYDRKGMAAEARAEYDRVRGLSKDNTSPYNWDFGTSGRGLDELEDRAKKGSFSPYELACLYAAARRPDDAVRWLTKACDSRDPSVAVMKVDPELDPIRADPRFQDLLRRVRLAEQP